jgi:hypothetical protein
MSFVIPLEKNTRLSGRKAEDVDEDEVSFRASRRYGMASSKLLIE